MSKNIKNQTQSHHNQNSKLSTTQKINSIVLIKDIDSEIISIEDEEKTLKITKKFKSDMNIIKNEWKFQGDRYYYKENAMLNTIFNEEIQKKKYFFNFQKNFRGSMILLVSNNKSFLKIDSEEFLFLSKVIKEIYDECFGGNMFITISYVYLSNGKYIDIFNFDDIDSIINKKYKPIMFKMKENNDVFISKAKEIYIKESCSVNNIFENISKLIESSTNKHKHNHMQNQYEHEVITLRMYDKNKNFFSKFQLVLYKAYTYSECELNRNTHESSSIIESNTRENSLFLNSILRKTFRDSKLTSLLKDTADKNVFFISILYGNKQNIVVLHDILTIIKQRNSDIKLDFDEEYLKNEFERLKIKENEKEERKRSEVSSKFIYNGMSNSSNQRNNFDFINSEFTLNSDELHNFTEVEQEDNVNNDEIISSLNEDLYNDNYELDIERIQKIKNKVALKRLFEIFENS